MSMATLIEVDRAVLAVVLTSTAGVM